MIVPSPVYAITWHQGLVSDVMILLDYAFEGAEQVTTYDLAEQIIESLSEYLVEPKPRVRVPARTAASAA